MSGEIEDQLAGHLSSSSDQQCSVLQAYCGVDEGHQRLLVEWISTSRDSFVDLGLQALLVASP